MSLNPFKWFKRAQTIEAMIWDKNARETRRCRLSLTGEVARDLKTDRTYIRAGCTPIPTLEGRNVKQVYHFDEETGAGLRFEKSPDVITLLTNPGIATPWIAASFGQTFGVLPSMKQVIIGALIQVPARSVYLRPLRVIAWPTKAATSPQTPGKGLRDRISDLSPSLVLLQEWAGSGTEERAVGPHPAPGCCYRLPPGRQRDRPAPHPGSLAARDATET